MDNDNQVTRRELIRHLNDNVLQNIDKKVMGLKKYHDNEFKHEEKKSKKDPLHYERKEEIA